jgi:hypothetical protein
MADGKHETRSTRQQTDQVIGEHKTEPTTAPFYTHPASVRPGAAPSTSIASSPRLQLHLLSRLPTEPSADATAATTPTPGEHAACPDCSAKQNVSKNIC